MIEPAAFSFSVETDITFGIGAREKVGATARRFGRRAALVAGDRSFGNSPHRAEIEASLAAAGVEIVLKRQPEGEPTLRQSVELGEALRSAGAEVVIGVGGGSAIDLAKAGAVAYLVEVDLVALAAGERFDGRALPVVAVPTTAGSGAEASRAAIVLDEAAGRKRGIRGKGVAARVAVVDPELVVACPPAVSAQAGFDALSHALETALSRASSPVTRALSVEAFGQLLGAVPRSLDQPGDLVARSAASYGALLMGINLANSTTCLPHRLQYPVGALTRTEHARGVAALTPAWLSRMLEHAAERLAMFAPASGRASGELSRDARLVVDAVLGFVDRLGLRLRLRDLGVGRADLERLADMVEGAVENDPGPSDRAAILELYEASF